ncbi:MAG: hypothetical protein ACK4QL_10385 [Pseudanabaenaceae cyanobacterium]
MTRSTGDEDTIALTEKVVRGGMEHNFYTYKLGDEYHQILDEGGTNILILQDIHSKDVEVKKRSDGFYVVLYQNMPILEYQGIQYIQAKDGCYDVKNRWGV